MKLLMIILCCSLLQISHAQQTVNAYQIENKATGLLLRPMDANNADSTPMVVYPHQAWRCMTWDLLPAKETGAFTLKNYFTHKTFQSTSGAKENAALVEMAIQAGADSQQWQFVKVEGGYYKIAAPHSDLVATVEGTGVNAKVVLKKWANTPAQLWKLLPKPEDFTG